MTKKRITALVIASPIILIVITLMALTAFVGYAITGKWEFRELARAWVR